MSFLFSEKVLGVCSSGFGTSDLLLNRLLLLIQAVQLGPFAAGSMVERTVTPASGEPKKLFFFLFKKNLSLKKKKKKMIIF